MKSTQLVRPSDRRCAMEKSDHRHRRLLRARRERPRGRRTTEQRYERASCYCLPVHPGSCPIRFSIQAIKTGKEVGRNGEAVRQMCTAEILSHPCRRWVDTVEKVLVIFDEQ
jgi:hypothetical protein